MSALKSVCLIYYLSLKSTHGCPPPINYSVPDITNNNMSYTATGLMPYTHYMVKVVAINGEGDGHPANETVNTNEEGTIQTSLLEYHFPLNSKFSLCKKYFNEYIITWVKISNTMY